MRHEGKVAIVTGAAQGIGLACAQRLHAEGAKVLLADVNIDRAQAALKDFDKKSALAVKCDVSSRRDIDALVETAVSRFGGLDIMVNNAGTTVKAEPLDVKPEDFDRVLDVNLKGTFFGCQAAAKVMVEKGKGAIVNMSSVQAEVVIPFRVPYGISKAAINQLTKIFAVALGTKGVRVNAVGPGTIFTDLTRQGVLADEKSYRDILSRTPMGRCGEPAEIASVVSFLASDDASYVTGQIIYPDGGRLALNYTVPVGDLPK